MKQQIMHLRGKNFNGGMTIVATYNATKNLTAIEYSICSIEDNFCKQIGVAKALRRKTAYLVMGKVPTNKLASTTLMQMNSSTRKLALKSIYYSMFGIKLTNTSLRKTNEERNQYFPILTQKLIQKSEQLGNNTSFNEIRTLNLIIQFL